MSVQDERGHWKFYADEKPNPYTKCEKCYELWGDGRSNYHNKGYCQKYSYEEYLKLKNDYPAKTYDDFSKEREINWGNQTYIPEIWKIEKDTIYAAISALKLGLEYAKETLIIHDQQLGRSLKRHREWAENIEIDIKEIQQALDKLKNENN